MASADFRLMIAPSAKTIQATFDEMALSTNRIKGDIQSLLDTLRVVNDTMGVFTNSPSLGAQFAAMNPFALLPTTIKVATEVVSKYVTKKTGISFTDWANFVDSALKQFEDYAGRLDSVTELSAKYDKLVSSKINVEKAEISADENILLEIKSNTQTWKSYIEKIAKLILVLDAILDSQGEALKQTTEGKESGLDINNDIKKMFGVATDKFDGVSQNKVKDVLLYFFSSVYDLKDRTKDFSDQTKQLLPKISELENLLDLGIAQIQVYGGKISAHEIEILESRVAAAIIVPQLKSKLASLKTDAEKYNNFLERLNTEFKGGSISEKVYKVLLPEYTNKQDMVKNLLEVTEQEARTWKADGISLLDNGMSWIKGELEVVRSRKLIGQLTTEELQQKSKVLNQELRRLDEAKDIIKSL